MKSQVFKNNLALQKCHINVCVKLTIANKTVEINGYGHRQLSFIRRKTWEKSMAKNITTIFTRCSKAGRHPELRFFFLFLCKSVFCGLDAPCTHTGDAPAFYLPRLPHIWKHCQLREMLKFYR